MNIDYTKEIVERALRSDPMTYSVKTGNTWIVVRFLDDTFCYLDLQSALLFNATENKIPLNEDDVKYYSTTQTVKEFVQEIRRLEQTCPGIYYTFMIIKKFVELGIITNDMAELVLQKVDTKELELELNQFYTLLFSSKYQN